jgi:hypothetical protein
MELAFISFDKIFLSEIRKWVPFCGRGYLSPDFFNGETETDRVERENFGEDNISVHKNRR